MDDKYEEKNSHQIKFWRKQKFCAGKNFGKKFWVKQMFGPKIYLKYFELEYFGLKKNVYANKEALMIYISSLVLKSSKD